MKSKAIRGKPGIRVKENGKFIACKSINGKRFTKEFSSKDEAWEWKNDRRCFDVSVNGKDPTLSDQGESRNAIYFRDVYLQYQKEGMVKLRKHTITRKVRRMNIFFRNLANVKMSDMTGRVVLQHILDMKLLVSDDSRRCNFDKEIKDLSSVFAWYDEDVAPFPNPIRRKHFDAGFIKPVPRKNRNLPPEALPVACAHMRKSIRYLMVMQFLLGARIGEACAINTKTTDFRRGLIDLSETIIWPNSKPVHQYATKTDTPNVKTMTPLMRRLLMELDRERPKGCIYYFHLKGRPLRYNLILQEFNKALVLAGYGEYSGTHSLRYAMGSFSRKEAGLDVAQAMLAHSDARMTEGYAKLDVNEKVTGVVIQAEERFFGKMQPSCNQESENVI